MFCYTNTGIGTGITKMVLSLMMALNERCPNAWHMLIERLILFKFN